MNPLISVSELSANLDEYKVVDATWLMPSSSVRSYELYLNEHIPGAIFFDIDLIADTETDLPHMLPAADVFSKAISALGISNEDKVVVYDAAGIFSSPRVWWEFKAFGHENVAVLNGGLPAWKAAGLPVSEGVELVRSGKFIAEKNANMVSSISEVEKFIGVAKILDARSPDRFNGVEAEPRKGVTSGHIPGSICVHYRSLLDDNGLFLKSADELNKIFASVTAKGEKVITTCGSGITACILALGLELTGRRNWSVYDGSWAEWGSRKSLN